MADKVVRCENEVGAGSPHLLLGFFFRHPRAQPERRIQRLCGKNDEQVIRIDG